MMSYSNINKFVLCFVVFVCLFAAGCGEKGPNTATITGTITLDGRPTASIDVMYEPEMGRPGYGYTDESGQYKIRFTQNSDGCIPGKNRVTLRAYTIPGDHRTQFLPKRYNEDANDNPDLHVDVKPGPNVFNFDVLSK